MEGGENHVHHPGLLEGQERETSCRYSHHTSMFSEQMEMVNRITPTGLPHDLYVYKLSWEN